MADNYPTTPGAGRNVATDQVTYSDDVADIQLVRLVRVTGSEGSKVVAEIVDADGLDVDVTRLPTLPAGTNTIGKVDLNAGTNYVGKVRLTDGTTDATVRDLAANDALNVAIVDGSGNHVTTFGGTGGTSSTDDADFTAGTTPGTPGMGVYESTPTTVTDGDMGIVGIDQSRRLKVNISAVTATATAASVFRSLDLDETEEDVKTSAGTVYGMWVTNTATTTRFIKFYNATAATVVVGTTTPVLTIGIPGNSSDDVSGVFNVGGPGLAFSTAICVAATTGVLDNDTGAPGANDVIVNIFYE